MSSVKKIAISNFWFASNYGAVMTALALCRVVEKLGYEPTLIDAAGYQNRCLYWRDRNNVFRQFIANRNLKTTEMLSCRADFEKLNDKFGSFVVGSDQIWNYGISKFFNHFFYLDYVEQGRKKIAVSASFGKIDCAAPSGYRAIASLLMRRFDAISVREKESLYTLQKYYDGQTADFVIDPVFLCDKSVWDEFTSDEPLGDYVFSYCMGGNSKYQAVCDSIASRMGLENRNFADGLCAQKESRKPEEWLQALRNCKHIVTDSFHAVCFAIIFKKSCTFLQPRFNELRVISLLNSLGISNYLVTPDTEPDDIEVHELDWTLIYSRLDILKTNSLNWLRKAFSSAPKEEPVFDACVIKALTSVEEDMKSILDENQRLQQEMTLLLSLPKLIRRYRHYRLMSKLVFGKKRRLYIEKKQKFRSLVDKAKLVRNALIVSVTNF